MISSGTLYWVCFGNSSDRLRWNTTGQRIRVHTTTPTTSAAIVDHVQSSRIRSACGVTPSGQPNRRTSSIEHPVAVRPTNPTSPDNLARRADRARTNPTLKRPPRPDQPGSNELVEPRTTISSEPRPAGGARPVRPPAGGHTGPRVRSAGNGDGERRRG